MLKCAPSVLTVTYARNAKAPAHYDGGQTGGLAANKPGGMPLTSPAGICAAGSPYKRPAVLVARVCRRRVAWGAGVVRSWHSSDGVVDTSSILPGCHN